MSTITPNKVDEQRKSASKALGYFNRTNLIVIALDLLAIALFLIALFTIVV